MDKDKPAPLSDGNGDPSSSRTGRDGGPGPRRGVSRRYFLKGVGGGVAATLATGAPPVGAAGLVGNALPAPAFAETRIALTVNGVRKEVEIEARSTLLSVLRNRLDLTGAKPVCDRGECGACTVLVDGKPAYSCMMLAADAEGREIRTVEGLASGDKLHPIQEAFIECDGYMCGFCTPGHLMALAPLVDGGRPATLDDVKQAVAGNVCRCGAAPRIFEAGLKAVSRAGK